MFAGVIPDVQRASGAPPQIEEFLLERLLGRGAAGEVWLARDTLLERAVAVKIALGVPGAEERLRFRVEARAMAMLHHPNLPVVHRVGEIEGRPFLVTELLSGTGLDRIERPVAPERVVAIGLDLGRALVAAHRAGVLHRDVKPANAFLCDDGTAKLLDFGLAQLRETPAGAALAETVSAPSLSDSAARTSAPDALEATSAFATASGRVAGTPLYMAPEAWRGEPATRRTDVYSLGALLFELLAGRTPYEADTLEALRDKALSGVLPDLASLAPAPPAALVDLVMRCLHRRAEERPVAEDVCAALEAMKRAATAADEGGDAGGNPYRGLLAFGPEHRALFFGRDAEAASVLAEMRAAPMVLVVGASGAGKSSLVRAGVLPRVERGALSPHEWKIAVMVPSSRPIERLAQALSPIVGASEEESIARTRAEPSWIAERAMGAGKRIALLVDQIEEAWTLCDAGERASFFAALGALAGAGPDVRLVATLRADFLDRLEDMGEVQAQALRAPVVLGAMSGEGVARAIAEPARRRGVEVEPELVESLARASEALPLLQFALSALWERREDETTVLRAADLQALGGLEGALATHADGALARLSAARRAEARRLLLALVTLDRTRARREEQALLASASNAGEARAALEALVEARLLVASAGEQGTAYEIAHEAIVSGWPAMRAWLDEEAAARAAAARLERAAGEWDRLGRGDDGLLGERQLGELDLLEGRLLGPREKGLIDASRATARAVRLRRRAIRFGVPLVVALVLATVWIAGIARRRSEVARIVAEARALDADAERTGAAADDSRARALALFDKDDVGPAEDLWKQMLAREQEADDKRRDVGAVLDRALAIDPRDTPARALYADVVFARVLSAERTHAQALLPELRARLTLYDDGTRAARLRAPGAVSAQTDPPGAALVLSRYRDRGDGHLVESDAAPFAAGERRTLEAGSYLLAAKAPGRAETRYPFTVARGEERQLAIALPRPEDVPEGMIYVPAGRFLYGSGDDEATRAWLTHQPMRALDLPAFLVARTETTYGDYLAFLRALPESERKPRTPDKIMFDAGGRAHVDIGDAKLAEGESLCLAGRPCVEWPRLPVVYVSRDDAEAYAAWLSRSGRLSGARLCTDREWERAVRGADARTFPWGDAEPATADACTLATYGGEAKRAGPCEPGSHAASRGPFGPDDMTGNVWEWVAGTPDVAAPSMGIVRGGGYSDFGLYLALANRGLLSHKYRSRTYGLRVCADAR